MDFSTLPNIVNMITKYRVVDKGYINHRNFLQLNCYHKHRLHFLLVMNGELQSARELYSRYLLDINYRCNYLGQTFLHNAVFYNATIGMIKNLIEYGFDINAINNKGLTPIKLAAINKRDDVVKYLVRSSNIDLSNIWYFKSVPSKINHRLLKHQLIKKGPIIHNMKLFDVQGDEKIFLSSCFVQNLTSQKVVILRKFYRSVLANELLTPLMRVFICALKNGKPIKLMFYNTSNINYHRDMNQNYYLYGLSNTKNTISVAWNINDPMSILLHEMAHKITYLIFKTFNPYRNIKELKYLKFQEAKFSVLKNLYSYYNLEGNLKYESQESKVLIFSANGELKQSIKLNEFGKQLLRLRNNCHDKDIFNFIGSFNSLYQENNYDSELLVRFFELVYSDNYPKTKHLFQPMINYIVKEYLPELEKYIRKYEPARGFAKQILLEKREIQELIVRDAANNTQDDKNSCEDQRAKNYKMTWAEIVKYGRQLQERPSINI